MKYSDSYRKTLNKSLRIFFSNALRITMKNPSQAFSFVRTLKWLTRAARIRKKWIQQNVPVCPIIIFSITNKCNLRCKGCYAQSFHEDVGGELSDERLRTITEEAKELGVSFFVLAGGEPFMRKAMIDIMEEHPEIIFLVFTNGLLIDAATIQRFKKHRNVVPMISLEGDEAATDKRRGEGTYRQVLEVMQSLQKQNLFFGNALTLTRENFDEILDENYIANLVAAGCQFFLYIEYTPTAPGTDDWVLTEKQESQVRAMMERYREKYPALFIAVPWDEDDVGGCLSAGRGFVHINARGDLEPCPFAPFSEQNLNDISLKEGFQSEFFRRIREVPELERENGGGCILWKERERVKELLS